MKAKSKIKYAEEKGKIGAQLKKIRLEQNLTLSFVAAEAKTYEPNLSDLEHGKINCCLETLVDVLKIYGKKLGGIIIEDEGV